jgi:NADH-quinone oxidoreductase subunit A
MRYWPLLIHFIIAVALVAGMIGLSHFLGERQRGRATAEPYESGVPPSGTARLRFSSQFYLIAMFFVIFDLEAVFIFAWAVVAREAGWLGYIEILIFISILGAALAYLWRGGALDWSAGTERLRGYGPGPEVARRRRGE